MKYDELLQVRIPPHLLNALKTRAERRCITVSSLVRQVLACEAGLDLVALARQQQEQVQAGQEAQV